VAGSAQHLALEMFKLRAKVNALQFRTKGSAAPDRLIGGQIQYSFETTTAGDAAREDGRVIAIAQTRTKRARAPERAHHAGRRYDGFEATTWYGLAGQASCLGHRPKGEPRRQHRVAMPDAEDSTPTRRRRRRNAAEVRGIIRSERKKARW